MIYHSSFVISIIIIKLNNVIIISMITVITTLANLSHNTGPHRDDPRRIRTAQLLPDPKRIHRVS